MKIKLFYFILILFATNELSNAHDMGALRFSRLFSNSDAIIAAKVKTVDDQTNEYVMTMDVSEVLYGNVTEKTISVSSGKSNGFFIPSNSYLENGREYVLFLKRNNAQWTFAGHANSNFNISLKDDLKSIINRFRGNRNVFGKNNSIALIGLFNTIQNERLKNILLHDLKESVVSSNTNFLNSLTYSTSKQHRMFGIAISGELKIANNRLQVENILATEADDDIRLTCIASLGDMGNKSSSALILPFLNNEKQHLRRSAIEALGKINDQKNLPSLTAMYAGEPDLGNRLAIIDALANSTVRAEVITAYKEFKNAETETFIKEYLDRKIAKLEK